MGTTRPGLRTTLLLNRSVGTLRRGVVALVGSAGGTMFRERRVGNHSVHAITRNANTSHTRTWFVGVLLHGIRPLSACKNHRISHGGSTLTTDNAHQGKERGTHVALSGADTRLTLD